ncbi:MAG: FecR family protein [Agriterribacter sp.]
MTVDRIWHILGKKLSGDASEEELNELEQLLRNHPELHYPIQNIADLWKLGKPLDGSEAHQALQRHLLRLEETEIELQPEKDLELFIPVKRQHNTRRLAFTGIAATLVVGLLSYFLFFMGSTNSTPSDKGTYASSPYKEAIYHEKNEVSTKTGSNSKIVLPDGSTVWLNAGSSIEYDKNFDREIREVSLNGEAYFDVTKDPERPFIIHTQKINIRVLGTAFNVKSYANDNHSETSLIHGSIEVTMKDHPEEKIIMKPSEKLVVMNDALSLSQPNTKTTESTPSVVVSKINYLPADGTVIETSWIDNRFIFRDKKFADLAHEMERKYGVEFRFDDKEAEQLMFSGNFKRETVEQVLQALQLANYFDYTIENDVITITK